MAHQKLSAQHFHHQPVYPRFQRAVQVKVIGFTDALPIRKDMGDILESYVILPYRYRIPLAVYLLLKG